MNCTIYDTINTYFINESLETFRNINFLKVTPDIAFDDIKRSTNKDSLNSENDVSSIDFFKDCTNYRILYKNIHIGDIAIDPIMKVIKDADMCGMYLNNVSVSKRRAKDTLYIKYLEIFNHDRNLTGVASFDILISLLRKLAAIAKKLNKLYIITGGKNSRLDAFYMRGGFKKSPCKDHPVFKQIFNGQEFLRFDVTSEAAKESELNAVNQTIKYDLINKNE